LVDAGLKLKKTLTIATIVPLGVLYRHTDEFIAMKKSLFVLILFLGSLANAIAQRVDSIFFNLYTDSLKKGTHNYINIDGKMSDGSWRPLTAKEINFSSNSCEFSGNELIIPEGCREEKILVKAVLKNNPAIWRERTIWIKKLPDPDLPTKEEVLRKKPGRKRNG
jgi:hypothetical protein